MSGEPSLKSVPVVMSPIAQYFVGRLLMLRERLSYEQWGSFERSADVICDSVLKQMPVDHPESAVWDNRRKGDQGAPR
jgi:hypothetical protein